MRKNRAHSCGICGKNFYKVNQLNQHLIIHRPADEKPFRCTTCCKTFSRSHHLKVHSMTYTKEGPYACDVCGHRCCQQSDLKKHRMLHSGERPHSCPVCGKGFVQVSGMKRHMRCHGNHTSSPVSCDICGQQFERVCFLEEHLPSHANELPFSCNVCGNRFAQERSLKQHSVIHSSNETHCCEKCGKIFKRFLYLEKHMKTHWERFSVKSCKKRLQKQRNIECNSKSRSVSASSGTQMTYSETSEDSSKNVFVSEKVYNNVISLEEGNNLRCLTESDGGEELIREPSSFSDCSVQPEKNVICVIENNFPSQSTGQPELMKNKEVTYVRYLRSLTVPLAFSCHVCRRHYTQESELKQHAATHSTKQPHRCQDCGKTFERLVSFEKHMKTHRSSKSTTCKKRRSHERHLKLNSASVSQVMQITGDAETLIDSTSTDFGSGETCEKLMSVGDEFNPNWPTEKDIVNYDAEYLRKCNNFSNDSAESDSSVICVIENCFSLQSKNEPILMEEGMSAILWD